MNHLENNGHDRELGAFWEKRFCRLGVGHGRALTPMQLEHRNAAASWYRTRRLQLSRFLLPDVVIWTAPGEHHEIKHKNPTRYGCYGLEAYRLDALLEFAAETRQDVLYTIHDWQLAGATHSGAEMPNLIDHWRTVTVHTLKAHLPPAQPMRTWLNGKPAEMPGYYWPTDLWIPLAEWWAG